MPAGINYLAFTNKLLHKAEEKLLPFSFSSEETPGEKLGNISIRLSKLLLINYPLNSGSCQPSTTKFSVTRRGFGNLEVGSPGSACPCLLPST